MAVEDTLKERGSRYGDFADHALIAQELQDVMHTGITHDWNGDPMTGWARLSAVQKQALTVIADKIARILSGDPNYADNWHDIQGYARLAEERLDPNFNFGATIAGPKGTRPGQLKLVKPCCKYPNPNPLSEGLVPPYTYCINCGHRYKPGEVQDVPQA